MKKGACLLVIVLGLSQIVSCSGPVERSGDERPVVVAEAERDKSSWEVAFENMQEAGKKSDSIAARLRKRVNEEGDEND